MYLYGRSLIDCVQGHELQVGTNCLGPWLLTHLLTPILKSTAASSPPNSVRVAWAGSLAIDAYAPTGGVTLNEKGEPVVGSNIQSDYGVSKAGNLFLASEFGKRTEGDGIVSVVRYISFSLPFHLRTSELAS